MAAGGNLSQDPRLYARIRMFLAEATNRAANLQSAIRGEQ